MNKRIIAILLILFLVLATGAVFFIYTTTQSKPTALNLFLPKESETGQDNVDPDGAITLILIQNDLIYYYEGNNSKSGKFASFTEIRTPLIEKRNSTDPKKFIVIIKPSPNSTYKNGVDALDQMTINEIKRYAMVEITEEEQLIVDALKK